MIPGGDPRRYLTLVPTTPVPGCPHVVQRDLTWVCTLPVHGPEQAHVLRARRG